MLQNKYLIFDFDGVIGDTREATAYATSVVNNTDLDAARKSNLHYASHKPNHTRNNSLSDEDLKRIYKWTTDFGNQMTKIGFPLFDSFVQEIESIDTKYKAIVSSGSQRYVIPALSKTNISPTHILAYENHHSKEEKIEIICRDWDCKPSDVFYFTDTLADVYELRNMITENKLIGVSWGYCGKEVLLSELKPEHILDKPSDIQKLLVLSLNAP